MPTLTGVRLYGPKDTDANWKKNNPTLSAGELVIVTDSKYKFKIASSDSKYSDITFPVAEKATQLETARKIGSANFNGTSDITLAQIGAAAASHTHSNVIIKLNGGTIEGTDLFTYNGGNAKTINITPSSIGAAASSHTHNYAGSISPGGTANSAAKLYVPVNIGEASFDGSKSITLKEMGINNPIEITLAEYNQLKQSGKLDMEAYYNITDDYDAIGLIDDNSVASNQVFSSSKTESTYSKKSKVYDVTLSSSKWTSTSSNYEYTISLATVTETNTIEVNISSIASSSMITAYQSACLKPGTQSSGKFSILASVKPSIDISITVIVRNDI